MRESSCVQQSILNEKVYSAHSTLLLHTFPYHLHLTSFTWFLAVYYFILTSFTSPSATAASSSYTLVILLFSIRLLTHFTRFHSVYLNRYSLNSLRLLVESLWNWLWENRAEWRLRGRRRTDYKNTSCSHSLHPSTSASTWLIPLILLYSIPQTLNE